MITAKEARSITLLKSKKIDDILNTVKACANLGISCVEFSRYEVEVTTELQAQLIELGYTLYPCNKNFKISW